MVDEYPTYGTCDDCGGTLDCHNGQEYCPSCDACDLCGGEGYRVKRVMDGTGGTERIEVPCERCDETGIEPTLLGADA